MSSWQAVAGAACMLLCITLNTAAGQLSFDDKKTCRGALDMLKGCNAGMVQLDLQQHCCIPFHALEGMKCFW